jgi:hypothetical protein
MHETSEVIVSMLVGAALGLSLGLCLGQNNVVALHREAIETGAAYYKTDVRGNVVFTWNNGMSSSVQK